MNLDINKQYIKLDEKEMIAHTIDVFYSNENIDEIIVCIREEEEYFFEHEILDKYDFRDIKIAYGGKERQDSIYNGLKKLDSNSDIVLIHDGARPFVSHAIINETIQVAKNKKAAVVGVPVRDTIKVVENGVVKSVVLKKERNFLNTIGSKNPRGINMIIFEMTWLIVKVSNSQLNGIRLRR